MADHAVQTERNSDAPASEARLTASLLVRKGMAGPVSHGPRPVTFQPDHEISTVAPYAGSWHAVGCSTVDGETAGSTPDGSTLARELAKLTVRIPQARHQALRLAAARRGVSIQALVGDMIDALVRSELQERPDCACLKAALAVNGGACDRK